MRKVIIATHGNFSKGLKNSLEMIVGESAKEIETYSLYPGENALDFAKELKAEVTEHPEVEYVVLGDLFGASVVNSLIELSEYPNVFLISGVNLNVALEIMLTPPHTLTEEILEKIIDHAREGIKLVKVMETDDDEF